MITDSNENEIHIEVTLIAPPDRVWTILTSNEHIEKWWDDGVNLEPRIGGKFVEKWRDGDRRVVTSGEVTHFRRPELLEMTWSDEDWTQQTEVRVELEEYQGKTRLVLPHRGWEAFDGDDRKRLVDAHLAGWSNHIENLTDYISTWESNHAEKLP